MKQDPFEVYSSLTSKKNKQSLEWEESAVDQEGNVEEIHDHDRKKPQVFGLWILVFLFVFVFGFRLFYLQIIRGNEFRKLSENNRIRKQALLAPRGVIKDRFGKILAQNVASFNLVVVPVDLPKQGQEEELGVVAKVFGLDLAKLQKQIANLDKKSIVPVIVKPDISPEESILFKTRASEFLGFSVQEFPVRKYTNSFAFAHVLGYTGQVSKEDIKLGKQKYETFDFIGKSGVEQQYEQFLHGENGSNLVEVDASGRLIDVLGEDSPYPGKSLVLNLDMEFQEQIYESLKDSNKNRKAAAIALNPKTGEVLALVSLPSFDTNLFAHGIKKDDYENLLSSQKPLLNRAINGVYPPGSTVKPMVAAMAVNEGTIDESTIIYDRGVLVIPNQYDPQKSYNFFGWKRDGLGPMDVKKAIAQSSDIFFYTIAGGHPNSKIQGLGVEKIANYYRKFNLGRIWNIDLPGEKPGLVPDPAWKDQYYKNDPVLKKWYLGDTYHIGIGQGDMLVTPLQVAQWTAMIANNGVGFLPQVLKQVVSENGTVELLKSPKVVIENFLNAKSIKLAQEGMRETVLAGSGRQLNALPISSAGKTGTSQFDGSNPFLTHAWFTAYAPFENPQIVVTVLVEAGGEGHSVAVPVAKEALEWWVKNRYNKK